jgi:large subunit ribosomal protein L9
VQVVLRHDVESLGLRGEVVNVARGYARNYLLPRGLAELATPGLVAELARREAQHARHQARTADEARSLVDQLEADELRIDVKAGPTGSLFGSVTATTVADALWEARKIRIDRRKLELEPIKRVGRYVAPVELFAGVSADLRLVIVPEGGELPPVEEPLPTEPEGDVAAGSGSGDVVDESATAVEVDTLGAQTDADELQASSLDSEPA